MTEMSPQTQAVLDAYYKGLEATSADCATEEDALAAALRAAADQVVQEENVEDADYDCLHAKWAAEGKQDVRERFLKIAAELEGCQ